MRASAPILSQLSDPPVLEEDGGKGYNLKILTQHGLNVPDALILTASFYRQHMGPPPDFHYDDQRALQRECEAMRQAVLDRPLPESLRHELVQHLAHFGPQATFAVRSSSTAEDLAGAAFAGQHDTFLNVRADQVEASVRACLASLWSPHAVLYRRNRGFAQDAVSMAVVVQRMIVGTASGVAFSIDPVSGHLGHVLVEANYGVGESVVGGEAQTDSWIVDARSWQILDRRIGDKEFQLIAGMEGLQRKALTESERRSPCLTDAQVLEVAKTSRTLMALYDAPQDMEWTYADGTLYLLQARTQTTIPPRFTRDESAERFPEPLTPLTWSYVSEAFNHSLEYSLELMQVQLPTRPWFELKGHYVYGNQNAVELLALYRPIRATTLPALVEEIPALRVKFQWVRDLPQRWMRDLDRYLLRLGPLYEPEFDRFSCGDFQRYFARLFEVANDYFKPNIAISMTQAFLTRTLFGVIRMVAGDDQEAHRLLKQVLAVTETKTGQINRELHALSIAVRQTPGLRALLTKDSKAALRRLGEFPAFKEPFERFLADYGHRELSFDYYKPTWAEAPEVVLDLIRLGADAAEADDAHAEQDRRLRSEQLEATRMLYDQTPKELHVLLHELIRLTINFTFLDDLEHFQTTRMNLLARRAAGAFGLALQQRGVRLEDPYDLFFLTRQETQQIREFAVPAPLLTQIHERKAGYRAAQQQEPAWDLSQEATPPSSGGDLLKGVPGSPGEAEGSVYLVRGTDDFAGMPADAILVARTTNPAWTPLFYKAKGVITESGGPLSHGAVTARELGLPAVMCVKECFRCLKSGDRVHINGQHGTVRRLAG